MLPLDAYFTKHCFLILIERSFQVASNGDVQSSVPDFAFLLQDILDRVYNVATK